MLFHVLSSLPEFYFLFKSKAKKDILKEIVGLNPFYSAFFLQMAATSEQYFNKEKQIPR